eukprot:g32969.t1
MLSVCTSAADKKAAGNKKTAAKEKITYDDHVQPIFRAKCFSCHNTSKKSGGLDLTSYTALMQGGSSGDVIEAGAATDSYLFSLVTHESQPYMPPKSDKLAKASLDTIRKWIDGGALENSGSKPVVTKKKFNLALQTAPGARPAGPPPMPGRLSRQPLLRTKRTTAVTAMATSPWAPLAAVAGQQQVFLYDTKSLQLLGVLPFPEGTPKVLKFSRNGGLLLAGGGRGGARGKAVVWNVKTGERVIEVGDELDTVLAADISADHRLIALGGPQKLIQIYSTETGKLLHSIKKHTEWIYSIEFSPDSVLLATSDRNGGVFVWESGTGREYLNLKGHSSAVCALSWRTDSNILATGSTDTTIRLWEMENGRQVKSWGAHGGGVEGLEFTRDGRIVSCGRDRVPKLWDQNGKALRSFSAFSDIAVGITHCDESNRVIAGDWTGAIRVYVAADGKQAGTISSNPLTLEERLKAAQQTSATLEMQRASLVAAHQKAAAALAKIQQDLATAKATVTNSQKQIVTATAAQKAAQAEITKLAAEITATTKTIAQYGQILKPLSEAVAKAQEAQKAAPGDKALAAGVAGLKAQLDAKNTALAAANKTLTAKKALETAAKAKLAGAQKQIADAKAAQAAATKTVAALTPAVKPAADRATKAKQAADAATKSATDAKSRVQSLQVTIQIEASVKQLAALRTEYDKLTAAASAQGAEVAKSKAAVDAANAPVAALKKQVADAKAKQQTATAAVTAAEAKKKAVETSAKTIESALPLLKASIASAQQASAKVAGDKELAAAVKQLQAAQKRKTDELAAMKKDIAAQTAALPALQKAVTTASTEAAAMLAQLKTAEQKAAAASAALDAAMKSAAAAKALADAARAKMEGVQKQIQALDKSGGSAGSQTASSKYLEIEKWATILERLGYDCSYIAGKLDRPPEKCRLIEEAHFAQPEIHELTRRCFGRVQRTRQVTSLIHELTQRIKDQLYEAHEEMGFDLLIAENVLTIPMNIPLGLALVEFVVETAIPCIAHHHDFVWERERFLVNAVGDLIAQAFPPPLAEIHHVGINTLATREFSRRTGLQCELIPNVMDFASPPIPPDDYAATFREALGLSPEDRIILQPTRVIPRKRIESAIELVHGLDDRRYKLVIPHEGGDEGDGYVHRVRDYAKMLNVPLIFADELIGDHRGHQPDGRPVYTIWDAYAAADLVTYPSGYEGFGNAFLETIYMRRPIVCNRYSIYRTDIEPCGFDVVLMDGYVTGEVIDQTRALLHQPERVKQMVETNYRVAQRFFSYENAAAALHSIIRNIESEAIIIDEPDILGTGTGGLPDDL